MLILKDGKQHGIGIFICEEGWNIRIKCPKLALELEFSQPNSSFWGIPEECLNGRLTRHF